MNVIEEVVDEMERAQESYGPMNSPHEAVGVLQIELNEMVEEVHGRCFVNARREAIQIAAVALRFAEKLTQLEEKGII